MTEISPVIPHHLRDRSLFMVWGPPSHGPRSKVFARELGIAVENVYSTQRRGLFIAPWKYAYQSIASLRMLFRRRPALVFVQSPPSIAVLFVWLYCRLIGGDYVIDAHSAAMQLPRWTRPKSLHRFLARRALATIVTNEVFARRIEASGGVALVLRDIPTRFSVGQPLGAHEKFTALVVNTFAFDEPLNAVLEAASSLPDVEFLVTGNTDRAGDGQLGAAPSNVQFTGYIPDDVYYATMQACDVVVCLTTRDNTMQRGACEALSLGRPIITSDWPLLREYFWKGTLHVDPLGSLIARAVHQIQTEHKKFTEEILQLQVDQRDEWEKAAQALGGLIRGKSPASRMRDT